MITEQQLKEAILKSALDVPNFMSIADFDHEVRLLYREILRIIEENSGSTNQINQ